MVLTALAGGVDRGKRDGRVDPGKGVWLKTFIYIYIYIYIYIAARASPLILVIGLKTGGAGLEVADGNGGSRRDQVPAKGSAPCSSSGSTAVTGRQEMQPQQALAAKL